MKFYTLTFHFFLRRFNSSLLHVQQYFFEIPWKLVGRVRSCRLNMWTQSDTTSNQLNMHSVNEWMDFLSQVRLMQSSSSWKLLQYTEDLRFRWRRNNIGTIKINLKPKIYNFVIIWILAHGETQEKISLGSLRNGSWRELQRKIRVSILRTHK